MFLNLKPNSVEGTTKIDLKHHMLNITLEYLSSPWINLPYNFHF